MKEDEITINKFDYYIVWLCLWFYVVLTFIFYFNLL